MREEGRSFVRISFYLSSYQYCQKSLVNSSNYSQDVRGRDFWMWNRISFIDNSPRRDHFKFSRNITQNLIDWPFLNYKCLKVMFDSIQTVQISSWYPLFFTRPATYKYNAFAMVSGASCFCLKFKLELIWLDEPRLVCLAFAVPPSLPTSLTESNQIIKSGKY